MAALPCVGHATRQRQTTKERKHLWVVLFRNRTDWRCVTALHFSIIHFRVMKMFSFQYKTAKNQFYLLMMLIVN